MLSCWLLDVVLDRAKRSSDHEELVELDLSIAAGVCGLDHRLNIGEGDLDFEQQGEE